MTRRLMCRRSYRRQTVEAAGSPRSGERSY